MADNIGGLKIVENYKQFISYKLVVRADGKTDKLPMDPRTGRVCNAHNPAVWMHAHEVRALGLPAAFVFTDQDPYFFIDLDHCRRGDTWSPKALEICAQFTGCALEVSQSGTGLHIFGTIPEALAHKNKNAAHDMELYTSKRFVAMTGAGASGSADMTPPAATWRGFVGTYFAATVDTSQAAPWNDEPVPEWTGPEEDGALVKKMLATQSARSAIGAAVTAAQLWVADPDALGQFFPDSIRAFDWSSADAALLSHLAFWTGKNHARMERLFSMSALAERAKWRDRPEYRVNSVNYAVGACQAVYDIVKPGQNGTPDPAPVGTPVEPGGLRPGFQYLAAVDQISHFKDCVYIAADHKIFTPAGMLLKPDQFRVVYGGYVFAMDDGSNGKSTKSAWEAFTESQAVVFPRVSTGCFRPECPPGAIIDDGGQSMVNTYVPINTPSTPGDVSPFTDLLSRLLPVDADRGILIAYLAACVQHVGAKFQWAPLLQGAPGNGKTFIGRALTQAIGRRYVHLPEAKDIGNKFNSWLNGKLLIVLEEICNPGKKFDNAESLKWMITNDMVPSQGKGKDQTTGDNRANFIMFSNHKDAVQKTEDDRRFCVFYTAQQSFADFARWGMEGPYFPNLWTWAKNGGWAIITHYLQNYEIPSVLDPAGICQRAPGTTSTQEAVLQSKTYAEQAIMEAIESGMNGFKGGWISSMALDSFLQDKRITIAYKKRGDVVAGLGYVKHPGLPDGRATIPVIVEGGKPRLYALQGHDTCRLVDAGAIVKRYCFDQGYEVGAN